MKTKIFLLLPIVAIIIQRCTCRKELGCAETIYSFTIAAKAYPDKDSINAGDTIWIELNESANVKDNGGNNIIDYSGAQNLGSAISFIELLGNNASRDAATDFRIKVVKGIETTNTNSNLYHEFLFTEENKFYVFKAAFIPQKKGIYRISMSNAANVFTSRNKCTKANFTINFKETNQHLYFNEMNFGVIVPLPNGGYCFKVK
jgi:hypothetical protein